MLALTCSTPGRLTSSWTWPATPFRLIVRRRQCSWPSLFLRLYRRPPPCLPCRIVSTTKTNPETYEIQEVEGDAAGTHVNSKCFVLCSFSLGVLTYDLQLTTLFHHTRGPPCPSHPPHPPQSQPVGARSISESGVSAAAESLFWLKVSFLRPLS